jgi:hypothetical protein
MISEGGGDGWLLVRTSCGLGSAEESKEVNAAGRRLRSEAAIRERRRDGLNSVEWGVEGLASLMNGGERASAKWNSPNRVVSSPPDALTSPLVCAPLLSETPSRGSSIYDCQSGVDCLKRIKLLTTSEFRVPKPNRGSSPPFG